MTYDVVITDTAFEEIVHSHGWLAERNRAAAEKWEASLLDAIDKLSEHAHRYPLAPENAWYPGELRQLLMDKRRGIYRILFEIIGKVVYIVRVRHSARDLLKPEDF